jgi:hypothetical protein
MGRVNLTIIVLRGDSEQIGLSLKTVSSLAHRDEIVLRSREAQDAV